MDTTIAGLIHCRWAVRRDMPAIWQLDRLCNGPACWPAERWRYSAAHNKTILGIAESEVVPVPVGAVAFRLDDGCLRLLHMAAGSRQVVRSITRWVGDRCNQRRPFLIAELGDEYLPHLPRWLLACGWQMSPDLERRGNGRVLMRFRYAGGVKP